MDSVCSGNAIAAESVARHTRGPSAMLLQSDPCSAVVYNRATRPPMDSVAASCLPSGRVSPGVVYAAADHASDRAQFGVTIGVAGTYDGEASRGKASSEQPDTGRREYHGCSVYTCWSNRLRSRGGAASVSSRLRAVSGESRWRRPDRPASLYRLGEYL